MNSLGQIKMVDVTFDNKLGRIRDMVTGKMSPLKCLRADSPLQYSLMTSLDRKTALLVREKLKIVPARGDGIDAMVFRGRIAMALTDLEEKLKGNGG